MAVVIGFERQKTTDEEDDGSGIPGGAQPGDDGYKGPPEDADLPPTPPADLPDDGYEEAVEPEGIVLDGDHSQLSLKVGGAKPQTCVLKVKGAKIDVSGEWRKGDRFEVALMLQITGDHVDDSIDTLSGEVKSTGKAQLATICGARRIN